MAADEEPNLLATSRRSRRWRGCRSRWFRHAPRVTTPRAAYHSNRQHDLALAHHSPLGADLSGGSAGRRAARAQADPRRRRAPSRRVGRTRCRGSHDIRLGALRGRGDQRYRPLAPKRYPGRHRRLWGAWRRCVLDRRAGCGVAECRRTVCQEFLPPTLPIGNTSRKIRSIPPSGRGSLSAPVAAESRTAMSSAGAGQLATPPAGVAAGGDRQSCRRR